MAFSQLSTTIKQIKQFFLFSSSQKTELYNHLQFISIYCLLHIALKTCIYITISPISTASIAQSTSITNPFTAASFLAIQTNCRRAAISLDIIFVETCRITKNHYENVWHLIFRNTSHLDRATQQQLLARRYQFNF